MKTASMWRLSFQSTSYFYEDLGRAKFSLNERITLKRFALGTNMTLHFSYHTM